MLYCPPLSRPAISTPKIKKHLRNQPYDRPALIIHSKKVLEDIEAGENCTTKCVF